MSLRTVWWRFGRQPEPHGRCAACDGVLVVCDSCNGDWRGTACRCGVGLLCPGCARHWAS